MNNIPQPPSNQNPMINPSQPGQAHGFTDRNQRNGNEFNSEQGVPAITHFDEAKINQIIPNQNIIPIRNVVKGRLKD